MKILDATWFSTDQHTLGIVKTENDVGIQKFYIGLGNGINEEWDKQYIASHGGKVSPDYLIQFLTIPEERKEK